MSFDDSASNDLSSLLSDEDYFDQTWGTNFSGQNTNSSSTNSMWNGSAFADATADGGNNGGYSEQQPSSPQGSNAASQPLARTTNISSNPATGFGSGFGGFLSGIGTFASDAAKTGLNYFQNQQRLEQSAQNVKLIVIAGVVLVAIVLVSRKRG